MPIWFAALARLYEPEAPARGSSGSPGSTSPKRERGGSRAAAARVSTHAGLILPGTPRTKPHSVSSASTTFAALKHTCIITGTHKLRVTSYASPMHTESTNSVASA